jgi:tetratricopeptide (TPR) repeat protein
MAHTVESSLNTPTAELRNLLDTAERLLPTMDATALPAYLQRLDRIDALFNLLEAEHTEQNTSTDQLLRSESVRWADLQRQLVQRSRRLVKLAAAHGGFAALRAQFAASDGDWWRLDELVAGQQRRQMRRLLQTAAIIAVLLTVVVLAYQTWFAPDAETIALVSSLSEIERHVDAQEWESAFAAAETALLATPDNVEVLTWSAVIAEQLGTAERADRYRTAAKAQFAGQELQFYVLLGSNRYRAGDLEGATEAADTALAMNADEAQVHFLLGNIAEARGEVDAALAAFDRAAILSETDNPQLSVVSRMRYGFLLQQLQAMPIPLEAPVSDPEEAAESTPPAAQ